MSARARRRKRDTAENIYKTCIIFGNCPQDVKNKVENDTLADKVLKYASGAVFFGGLGISTGKAGTSALGATDTGVSIGREILVRRPFTPHTPIDGIADIGPFETPLGPPNRAPIDINITGMVEPTDPSVVVPVDTTVVPPAVVNEVITIPTSEIGFDGDNGAIIEAAPRDPHNTIISRTQYSNPTFDIDRKSVV